MLGIQEALAVERRIETDVLGLINKERTRQSGPAENWLDSVWASARLLRESRAQTRRQLTARRPLAVLF